MWLNLLRDIFIRISRLLRGAAAGIATPVSNRVGAPVATIHQRIVKGGFVIIRPDDLEGEYELPGASNTFASFLRSGSYNLPVTRLLRFFAANEGSVVIVGADLGFWPIHIALTFHRCHKVWAIEPDDRAYELLVRNIHRNDLSDKVFPIPNCAWRKCTEISLVTFPGQLGRAYVRGNQPRPDENQAGNVIKKSTVTLSALVPDQKISLIVIDVNGSEFSVIFGARQLIERDRPILIFNCPHGMLSWYGHRSDILERLVLELGYSCREALDTRLTLLHPFRGLVLAMHQSVAKHVFKEIAQVRQ